MSAPNETPMDDRSAERVMERTRQIVGSLRGRDAATQSLLLQARMVALLEEVVAGLAGQPLDPLEVATP